MDTLNIKQKIVKYGVSLSMINANNIETGLLSMTRINPLDNEQLLALSQETESIIKQFVNAFEEYSENRFEKYESGILFQYVFDKAVEATYKAIMDLEIDTQFIPSEPYEYHEPDLPYYIQLKLTGNVGKISHLYCKTIDYIDNNGYRNDKLSDWLLPVLLVASFIGIEFAQEMDFDNDVEMQHYLYEE